MPEYKRPWQFSRVTTPDANDAIIIDREGGTLRSILASYFLAWGNLTGKPSTFAPSAHTHAESDVTGLVADLAAKADAAATTTALAAKAPLASPALTGTPTAPTAANGTNTTQIATTAFVLANAPAGGSPASFTDGMSNGTLVFSVASNALTVALKTLAGADPSAGDAVTIAMQTASGGYAVRTITSALSVVVASGGSLGAVNNTPFRVWVTAFDDAGTVRLGVFQAATATGIAPLTQFLPATSALVGAGSTSAGVHYTAGAAVTAKHFRILGFADWNSGLVTAGTWATGPTLAKLFCAGMPVPGDAIQSVGASTTSQQTTANTTLTDTALTASITPTSPVNGIAVQYSGGLTQDTSGKISHAQIRRGGVAIGSERTCYCAAGAASSCITDAILDAPGSASAQTYTLARRQTAAATPISLVQPQAHPSR